MVKPHFVWHKIPILALNFLKMCLLLSDRQMKTVIVLETEPSPQAEQKTSNNKWEKVAQMKPEALRTAVIGQLSGCVPWIDRSSHSPADNLRPFTLKCDASLRRLLPENSLPVWRSCNSPHLFQKRSNRKPLSGLIAFCGDRFGGNASPAWLFQ